MKVRDLALGLKHLGEEESVEEETIFAIAQDGTTFTVESFEVEHHEDAAPGAVTVWLRIDEN